MENEKKQPGSSGNWRKGDCPRFSNKSYQQKTNNLDSKSIYMNNQNQNWLRVLGYLFTKSLLLLQAITET